MAKARIQEYAGKFADQAIRFTPYALKKTGLVQSQAFLKIADYTLLCAPFQLSMRRGVFLVVLSVQEIAFFQQFQKRLCSIDLTFQRAGAMKPLSLFLRGMLDRVGPVKGKQNVCMMEASLKGCPNELVEIIGDYLVASEGLKSQYESFSGKTITVDEPAAKLMRFNNYTELVIGPARTRATLVSLSVNSLDLRVAGPLGGIAEGEACAARLYFQVYQFTANGKVAAVSRGDREQFIVTLSIEFTPELVEIVDDYFFRQKMQPHARAAQPGLSGGQ
jgi:hypothetical protein